MDHVDATRGFTLQHLRFLVLDEADRLLGQSFNDWLTRLTALLDPRAEVVQRDALDELMRTSSLRRLAGGPLDEAYKATSSTPKQASLAPAWLQVDWQRKGFAQDPAAHAEPCVQKLLFSATMTRDPAQVAALKLRNPIYVSVRSRVDGDALDANERGEETQQEEFSIPDTLKEHMIVTTSMEKPLVLLSLLHRSEAPLRQVLCFTKSVESAARLAKLIDLFSAISPSTSLSVAHYSSDLSRGERTRVLHALRRGEMDVVICSDLISRGMDLTEVQHVVSYDVAVDVRKYVHRVGRTARAGKEGDAWSLVEHHEAKHFKMMLKTGATSERYKRVEKMKSYQLELETFREPYQKALEQLAKHFGA